MGCYNNNTYVEDEACLTGACIIVTIENIFTLKFDIELATFPIY